jgi:hypothetical protein
LYCKEGYFPRDGICIEAEVKVGGCLIQIDNGLCERCRNNFKLGSNGECIAIDLENDFDGCKTVRGDKNKCIECASSHVMDDLGRCRKEVDFVNLVNKGLSTLMVPPLTTFNKCKLASRFECKNCANAAFESDNTHLANQNYLLNILGASKYVLFDDQSQIDIETLMEGESPFIDRDNGTYSLESQGNFFIFCIKF